MGIRMISMVLASILAVATAGFAAEESPAKSTAPAVKKTVKKPAATKTAAKKSTAKTSKASSAKTAKKSTRKKAAKSDVKGRLPRNYGKLKVSDEQRGEILTIQKDYQDRIAKLLTEVEKLETRREADFHKVLDKSQRALLKQMTSSIASSKSTKKK